MLLRACSGTDVRGKCASGKVSRGQAAGARVADVGGIVAEARVMVADAIFAEAEACVCSFWSSGIAASALAILEADGASMLVTSISLDVGESPDT